MNYVIIAILVVMIAIGIVYTKKHFSGESCCCGGGGYKVKKKHLPNVIFTRKFTVDGMHCENCKQRVEGIVNDISDVSGSVDLKKKELTVSYAFLKHRLVDYLFLRTMFVFFDYEQPPLQFLAEYLAMMGLWVFLAHYLGKLLRAGTQAHSVKKKM